MKCDNCGNVYKNNLKCPLCGHHQAKIYHCSVCDTVIHFGQSHCPKCGSPTRYNKQEDISKKYSSKFISTDYSKHSRSTASAEHDPGTMQRWLFGAASGHCKIS